MKKRIFGAALYVGLTAFIAHLPLAWVAGPAMPETLSPKPQMLGTIWNGQVAGLKDINPVTVQVKPLRLFTGQLPVHFESQSPYLKFSGGAGLSGKLDIIADGAVRGVGGIDARFRQFSGQYHMSCLLYTSPSPRDQRGSRMPSSA